MFVDYIKSALNVLCMCIIELAEEVMSLLES